MAQQPERELAIGRLFGPLPQQRQFILEITLPRRGDKLQFRLPAITSHRQDQVPRLFRLRIPLIRSQAQDRLLRGCAQSSG